MCGIVGIVRWDGGGALEREVTAMTNAVAHRGPDGAGHHVGDRYAVGHRRLSIIDLEGGAQPMWDGERRYCITYNGELYNYLDLKAELTAKGHVFETKSDTEVVLHAYMEWGPDALQRLRGMFAFGIVDLPHNRLFLARDHFGIKPLYIRRGPGFFAFASEINALRVIGPPCAGDLAAVDLFLRYQYIPAPGTIFRGVEKIPPAHHLTVDFDGNERGPRRYWDLRFEPEEGTSLHAWVERFEAAIAESVRAHLVADVPFGVFLSGGVDSSLVAGNMREILGGGIKGFSIGFEDNRVSELPFAEEVAKQCSFELVSTVMRGDAVRDLPKMVAHYGEPFGDASMVPTWEVSRLARERVPMVLSGDGGDEGFAGYDSHRVFTGSWLRPYLSRLKHTPSPEAARALASAVIRRALGQPINDLEIWERIIHYFPEPARRKLWRGDLARVIDAPCPAFLRASEAGQRLDRLSYAQYLDIQTYLPYDILTKVDIASMAHGLEVRTPLIDLKILDLARRIPASLRMEPNGADFIGKQIPRRALHRWFPPSFIDRKKQGFGIPRSRWLARGGPARALLDEVIAGRGLFEFFEERTVRDIVAENDRGQHRDGWMWLLLVFGLWREANRTVSFT